MATFKSQFENAEIEQILVKSKALQQPDAHHLAFYYDEGAKLYRIFTSEEGKKIWLDAYKESEDGSVSPEITEKYEIGNFIAPSPKSITVSKFSISDGGDSAIILYGSTGNKLEINCATYENGSTSVVTEDYTIYLTFYYADGSSASLTTTIYYDYEKKYAIGLIDIDNYLKIGKTTISASILGKVGSRLSGTSFSRTAVCEVIELSISSDFNIAKIVKSESMSFNVILNSSQDTRIEIYLDDNSDIAKPTHFRSLLKNNFKSGDAVSTGDFSIVNLGTGKHSMYVVASVTPSTSTKKLYSNVLYYEFLVNKDDSLNSRYIMLSNVINGANEDIGDGSALRNILGNRHTSFTVNEYTSISIGWSYYGADASDREVSIEWKMVDEDGTWIPITTRDAYSIDVQNDIRPSDLSFIPADIEFKEDSVTREQIPHEFGIVAIVTKDGREIPNTSLDNSTKERYGRDSISSIVTVKPNASGLSKYTEQLRLELTANGRSNDEPSSTISKWQYTSLAKNVGISNVETITSTFVNQPWNTKSGWNGNRLTLNNRATCVVNMSVFDKEHTPSMTNNGLTFEIEFKSVNVKDDGAVILRVGGSTPSDSDYLIIKATEAILSLDSGKKMRVKFRANELVKISFIMFSGNSTSPYPKKIFAQINGVVSSVINYSADTPFNRGQDSDKIYIGNAEGNSGIEIKTLRVYNKYYYPSDGLKNFFVDSESRVTALIEKNDVVDENGKISINKLADKITIVQITADLSKIIGKGEAASDADGKLDITCPFDSSINMWCDGAHFTLAGQSTRNMPVPSLHVKLDYTTEDPVTHKEIHHNTAVYKGNRPDMTNELPKRRWAFADRNCPEKKFRLQSNYMDSSGCHNGAFLKMFNKVSNDLTIKVDGSNPQKVLWTPAKRYAENEYKEDMEKLYPSYKDKVDFSFPYNVNMVPDSIPCVVFWAKDDDDALKNGYSFLGQYVIMEEKKSDFTSGKRSIYSTVVSKGSTITAVDPYNFVSDIEGSRLWDNSHCRQIEIVENDNRMTLFTDHDAVERAKYEPRSLENYFEMVYPDPDDIADDGEDVSDYWKVFLETLVKPVTDTFIEMGEKPDGTPVCVINQTEFNKLYGTVLDRWHFAAYYCLALRNCCSDSMVRNMELTTYEEYSGNDYPVSRTTGQPKPIWLPKWWDVDMQLGLRQTGQCDLEPGTTRDTKDPDGSAYALAGKVSINNKMFSSCLWDGLENCPQFQEDVIKMDEALYAAGWTYENFTKIHDEQYINFWSETIYNESQNTKYIPFDAYLESLQGDRTPNRHWFIETSYNYFDSLHACGEFKSKRLSFKAERRDSAGELRIYFVPYKSGFFGWGNTEAIKQSGVEAKIGQTSYLTIPADYAISDSTPILIYNSTMFLEIDLSAISKYFVTTPNFIAWITGDDGDVVSEDSGLVLNYKKINIGMPYGDGLPVEFNENTSVNGNISALKHLQNLEYFNIQGLYQTVEVDFTKLINLSEFYARGTRLAVFNPVEGSSLTKVELPTTIYTLSLNCDGLTDSDGNCAITWFETTLDSDGKPTGIVESSIQDTVRSITVGSNLKTDRGAQQLVIDWTTEIASNRLGSDEFVYTDERGNQYAYELTLNSVNWVGGITYEQLVNIAKIKKLYLSGYIQLDTNNQGLTAEQMSNLINLFGRHNTLPNFDSTKIFNKTNILCIDCDGGNYTVNASGELVTRSYVDEKSVTHIDINQGLGEMVTFTLAGFPLVDAIDATVTWEAWKINDEEKNVEKIGGDDEVVQVRPTARLYKNDGLLEMFENGEEDWKFAIIGQKRWSEGGSIHIEEGRAIITIKRLVYPQTVRVENGINTYPISKINDIYQISEDGNYRFDSIFEPSGYTGHLSSENGGTWNVNGLDADNNYFVRIDDYSEGFNKDTELAFHFSSDDLHDNEKLVNLSYSSQWRDKNVKISLEEPVQLCFFKNLTSVLTKNADGNAPLFYALCADTFVASNINAGYTSQELKYIPPDGKIDMYSLLCIIRDDYPELDIGPLDFTTLSCGSYYIPNYTKNVSTLSVSGCHNFSENINIDGLQNYKYINTEGTSCNVNIGGNSKLYGIYFGSPSELIISRPENLNYLNVKVEDTSRLGNIRLIGTPSMSAFKLGSKLISQGSEALTSLYISDTSASGEEVDGFDIERLYAINNRANVNSTLIGNIRSYKMYKESADALTNDNEELTITPIPGAEAQWRYIPWKDAAFKSAIVRKPSEGGVGDGCGITANDAADEELKSLNNAIKGNTLVKDLSDLYNFTHLELSSDSYANSEFYGCANIEEIAFPSLLTVIGNYEFANMANLSSVDFSRCSVLRKIEQNAFSNCTNSNIDINLNSSTGIEMAYLDGFTNARSIVIEGTEIEELYI